MRTTVTTVATALAVLVLGAGVASAGPTPEQKCEAGKNDAAGKYSGCIAKAEKGFISTGDAAKYGEMLTKCEAKLIDTWGKLEAKAVAAGTVCPTTGDRSSVENFMDACGQSVAEALGGGELGPDPVTCASDLMTCNTQLDACEAGDTICSSELATCNANLGVCSGELVTCNANLAACSGTLATAKAGTAAAGDVVAGKTFTSSAGVGAIGTMVDNGAVAIMPGASAQMITAGYHNGSGAVSGDADLTASNIKNGVNIFGVVGNAASGCSLSTVSYTDNGNGTVTDNVTGLMWEKLSDDGSIHDWNGVAYTWADASAVKIATLNTMNAGAGFANHTDWRAPNIRELQTLVNFATSGPAIHSAFNSACAPGCTVMTCSCTWSSIYWSSSTYQPDLSYAWRVNFDDGITDAYSKVSGGYVRAVRGGS